MSFWKDFWTRLQTRASTVFGRVLMTYYHGNGYMKRKLSAPGAAVSNWYASSFTCLAYCSHWSLQINMSWIISLMQADVFRKNHSISDCIMIVTNATQTTDEWISVDMVHTSFNTWDTHYVRTNHSSRPHITNTFWLKRWKQVSYYFHVSHPYLVGKVHLKHSRGQCFYIYLKEQSITTDRPKYRANDRTSLDFTTGIKLTT